MNIIYKLYNVDWICLVRIMWKLNWTHIIRLYDLRVDVLIYTGHKMLVQQLKLYLMKHSFLKEKINLLQRLFLLIWNQKLLIDV